MPIPANHPLHLWLDSKSDYFPNPTAALKSRVMRKTTWCFQTVGCDYFVDVTIIHAECPEAVNHEVKIKIVDFAKETEDGQPETVKLTNFLPIRDRQPCTKDARWFSDLHLMLYTGNSCW